MSTNTVSDGLPWSSAGLVAVTGSLVPITSAAGSGSAAAIGAIGVVLVVLGVLAGRQFPVDIGGIAAFLGVVLAGAAQAPAIAVLAGMAGTVIVWDVGSNAVVLGRQLGTEADTVRVEALHGLASGAVGFLAAGAGFVLFQLGPTGQPLTTLFILLVAATLLLAALNR